MKIALCQMKVNPGKFAQNFTRLETMVREAVVSLCADMVVFPEMCLSGYLVGDLWTDDAFCAEVMSYNEKIAALSKEIGIVIVYGSVFLEPDKKGEDGRVLRRNAVYICDNGALSIRYKTSLPNYRFFDDKRYFYYGDAYQNTPVRLSNGSVAGFEICEDLWVNDYLRDVTSELAGGGADFIVNISASPWSAGKARARLNAVRNIRSDKPLFYTNCVGAQNNGKNILTFDGNSGVYLPCSGENVSFVGGLPAYEEGILLFDSDGRLLNKPPVSVEEDDIPAKIDAIVTALRWLANESLDKEVNLVTGLSGGIDSAVSVALAVRAIGAGRVLALGMPSRFSSEKTRNAAARVARNLGISYETMPIEKIAGEIAKNFDSSDSDAVLRYENIQAKTRGLLVTTYAATHGALLLNNGNKVELALGYSTLYGDMCGAAAPVADLLKTEIWAVASHLNHEACREIIPGELIPDENFSFGEAGIAPSAELKPEQTDPMKWGYHDALLNFVMTYHRGSQKKARELYDSGKLFTVLGISEHLAEKYQLYNKKVFEADLDWFFKAFSGSVFKRVQAPPIVVTSKSAFGYDYRESIL